MGSTGMGGEHVVVTRVSSRMAPAQVGHFPPGGGRTLFAVGRLTWRDGEIRVVERGSEADAAARHLRHRARKPANAYVGSRSAAIH